MVGPLPPPGLCSPGGGGVPGCGIAQHTDAAHLGDQVVPHFTADKADCTPSTLGARMTFPLRNPLGRPAVWTLSRRGGSCRRWIRALPFADQPLRA